MLTTTEVVQRLRAPYPTVMAWIKRGILKAVQQDTPRGPVWMVPESAVESFERPAVGRPPRPEKELKYPRRASRKKARAS